MLRFCRVNSFYHNISRKQTKVTILATYNLIKDSLKMIIQNDRRLSVLDMAGTNAELLRKVSKNTPDVVLICLMDNEVNNVEIISDLLEVAPQTKVLILTSPINRLDQRAVIKLGVTGIVGTNQSLQVLVRAIIQVSEGRVWLNQKLIARILRENEAKSNNGKSENRGLYKGDNLTTRELEVVEKVGLGMTNKDISKKLYISEATVRHHLSTIYSKLNVEDRVNLAIYAYSQGIVQPPVESM